MVKSADTVDPESIAKASGFESRSEYLQRTQITKLIHLVDILTLLIHIHTYNLSLLLYTAVEKLADSRGIRRLSDYPRCLNPKYPG